MIKRSFNSTLLITGILLSGAVAAPAFAQSYGIMPRGACPKQARVAKSTPVYHQPAYEVAYSSAAPVREAPRAKRRGFGSPF